MVSPKDFPVFMRAGGHTFPLQSLPVLILQRPHAQVSDAGATIALGACRVLHVVMHD